MMKMTRIRIVVVLMFIGATSLKGQWHTKWHEVIGEATIVLANTKDIHDDINVSAKKKMVMDATLDALQNAINLRLNPVVSTQAYKTILEKDYLTINDHLIDLLAAQDIVWQRQASPVFVQDETNPKKWSVVIQGLVKKSNSEVPPPVITQTEPPKPKRRVDPVPQPKPQIKAEIEEEPEPEKVIVKKERTRKPYQRFLLGINAGATYDLPTSLDLDGGGFIDVNEAVGYKLGVRLPLARNFVIGADYMVQEWEFGEDFGYGGFGSIANAGSHHNGGRGCNSCGSSRYNDFDASHFVTMEGFGFSIGSVRNFINPSIGVFYQRGEISEIGGSDFVGEVMKRGATFGLDFGRGRLKLGVEASAFWLNTSANFDGFGEINQPLEILSDVKLSEANWSFGVNLKLFL